MFRPKYIFQKVSQSIFLIYVLIFNGVCSEGLTEAATGYVLRNFVKFMGKHMFMTLFFNKVAGLWPGTLLKMRLWHRCFPVNFAKFLRTTLCGCFLNKAYYYILNFYFSSWSNKVCYSSFIQNISVFIKDFNNHKTYFISDKIIF